MATSRTTAGPSGDCDEPQKPQPGSRGASRRAADGDRSPSPPAAAGDEAHDGPPKIVRTQAEIDAMSERLYQRDFRKLTQRRKEFEEELEKKLHHNETRHFANPQQLSPKEEEAVKHLYTQAMEQKKKAAAAAVDQGTVQSRSGTTSTTKTFLPEELEQIADRLCHQTMRQHKAKVEEAARKVYPPSERRILDKEALEANVKSVYTAAVEKKKAKDEKLREKYLFQRKVQHAPLTPDEVKALGDRLATTAKH